MSKQRDRAIARAAKLGDGAAKVEPPIAPLRCPTCGAPVPLGTGNVATCTSCSAQVPLPEPYRKLRDAERSSREDRAAAEALYEKLSKPSRVLDAWVAFSTVASGAFVAIVVAILSVSAVFVFLAGFALELVLHWVAPVLGIDLIDRFGGGTVYAAFALGIVALGLFPIWLNGYLQTSGQIRQTLRASLAARPPERPGFPSTCRMCGAALDVPPGALGVRCAYCDTDNLLTIPAAVVQAAGARQEQFHRSIIDAAARAKALRAEARAGLPKAARNCAIFVVVFGLVGRGCTSLDMDTGMPSWSDTMGSPRRMAPPLASDQGVPMDTDFTLGFTKHVVALRSHEVLELVSRDSAECRSVSVQNMTTFPLITRSWDIPWGSQTDGTYGGHWRAPYTALYLVEIGGPDGHFQWRIGTHSHAGLAPAPPIKIELTSPPHAKPMPEAGRHLPGEMRLVADDRPDTALTANDHFVYLWSLPADQPLAELQIGETIASIAISPDGSRIAAVTDQLVLAAVHDGKLHMLGTFCESEHALEAEFVTPDVVAVSYSDGRLIAHSAKDGRALYELPKLGGIKSLRATGGALVVVTESGAFKLTTPRWDPR
ncbi:MAG TPA: hypothetical protein VMJ10_31450 [Kofleriaceae bacterium]|nr:hypothetical protein [Kofleriaceae bacterium]